MDEVCVVVYNGAFFNGVKHVSDLSGDTGDGNSALFGDANMLVLTTGPISQYTVLWTKTAFFDAVNANPWGTLPVYYALPRCMILFAVSIIGSHAAHASAKKVLENADEAETCRVAGTWKKRFDKMNQQSGTQFYASVGYAVGNGAQIEEIVHRADERMYEEKRKSKEQSGQ